jgi:hypothetical protein
MAGTDNSRNHSNKLRLVTQRRQSPVFVCGKCLARHPKGKKLKAALRSELKQRRSNAPLERPRLIETSCFGICPKGAIVLSSNRLLRRRSYLLLAGRKKSDEAIELLLDS